MAKFRFKVEEWNRYWIEFEAENLEQAKELLDESIDYDELPEAQKFWTKGETTITNEVKEIDERESLGK